MNLSSPGQVLVVEGVDVVLANIGDSDQGAVHPWHCPVDVLQELVVRVLLSEVVHLRRKKGGSFKNGNMAKVNGRLST